MIITTTENIHNHEVIEVLGTTFGVVVRARGIGGDIMASLKGLVGGEVKQYTQMIEDARRQAIDRIGAKCPCHGRQRHYHDAFRQR